MFCPRSPCLLVRPEPPFLLYVPHRTLPSSRPSTCCSTRSVTEPLFLARASHPSASTSLPRRVGFPLSSTFRTGFSFTLQNESQSDLHVNFCVYFMPHPLGMWLHKGWFCVCLRHCGRCEPQQSTGTCTHNPVPTSYRGPMSGSVAPTCTHAGRYTWP